MKMNRSQIRENKLEVLKIVKEKKNILFGSIPNNEVDKKEKKEAWQAVLRMAQSLGLASGNRQWTYARDHLFGLWKSRTLARRDNLKKPDGTNGKRATSLDELDREILNILENDSSDTKPVLNVPEGGVVTNYPLIQTQQQHQNFLRFPSFKEQRRPKRKATDSLDDIRKEILESELYINKLKILKLEKEMGLPPSKFTSEFLETQFD